MDYRIRIETLLRERGARRPWLAERTEISVHTINSWFRTRRDGGMVMPAALDMTKVAQVLDTSVEWLMTGDNPSTVNWSSIRRQWHEWIDSKDDKQLLELESLILRFQKDFDL